MNNLELTKKETIELRLKCLEPYIKIASVQNIEQDTIIKKAEVAWEFAIKTITGEKSETTDEQPPVTTP